MDCIVYKYYKEGEYQISNTEYKKGWQIYW